MLCPYDNISASGQGLKSVNNSRYSRYSIPDGGFT